MSVLKWKKITDKKLDKFWETEIRHRAIFEKTFVLDYKKFGKRVWGSGDLKTGVYWIFSISPLKGERDEGYTHQLLISGLSAINGHVYLHSIKEGKEIAQKICDSFIKDFQSIK